MERSRFVKLPEVPLLISESNEEFQHLAKDLRKEIKPRGIVERIFVDDIAHLTWEIARLRRCQAGIINLQFREALADVLWKVLPPGAQPSDRPEQARDLADRWFVERNAKSEVRGRLAEFGLDISAIEAKAFIDHADELERIHQLIAFHEAARLKALSIIAQYREAFARQLRESSDRLIDRSVREVEKAKPRAAA